jgi:hypothetical protein
VIQVWQLNDQRKEILLFSEFSFLFGFDCVLAPRSRAAAGANLILIPSSAAPQALAEDSGSSNKLMDTTISQETVL